MEKVSSLSELVDKISQGYKAEVLFNVSSGCYEVPTWLEENGVTVDVKKFKFPKKSVKVSELIEIVYSDRARKNKGLAKLIYGKT